MIYLFKPEDFKDTCSSITDGYIRVRIAVEQANEKLNKLIESWPVVYGAGDYYWGEKEDDEGRDTHKARLAFIKEIKKEPCLHRPIEVPWNDRYAFDSKCVFCGVELVAEWKQK